MDYAGRLPSASLFVLPSKQTIIGLGESFVYLPFELEIESCRLAAGVLYPACYIVVVVPIFAHGELRLCRLVVHLGVLRAVAFHHIVAPSHIAEVVLQEVEIGFHALLYLCIGVVEVAASVEVVAGVGCAGRFRLSRLVGHLVVAAYRPHAPFVGHALVGLRREVGPVGCSVAVVDYHVFDDSCAKILESGNHLAQLLFRSKRRIVVGEPVHGIVTIARVGAALAAVGHPDKIEIVRQFTSVVLKHNP